MNVLGVILKRKGGRRFIYRINNNTKNKEDDKW